MNRVFSRNGALLAILVLLALVLAACGGGAATESPTQSDATSAETSPTTASDETEAVESETEAVEATEEAAASSLPETVASTFPCIATVVEDQGSVLQILHRDANNASQVIRASRAAQEMELAEMVVNEEGVWYRVTANNRTMGFVDPKFIILGEACAAVPYEGGE